MQNLNNKYNYNEKTLHNSTDLWDGLFEYSKNLNGNWFKSQNIFNNVLVPTAIDNPRLFAKWIDEAVDKSKIEIKQKSKYKKTIFFLKSLTFYKKRNKRQISKILFELLNTGLNDLYLFELNY